MRNKRFLRRGFLRSLFFKTQIINNGGWHFSFLKTPEDIIKKMNAYGHGELAFKTDKQKIENSIKSKEFFINPKIKLKEVSIDKTYPRYINNNFLFLKIGLIIKILLFLKYENISKKSKSFYSN